MPPKYPGQSSRPGPAGGKLIKGLVDPSKANRIRIRKRDKQYGKCEHNRQKIYCRECGGKGICHHNRIRRECRDCKGKARCEHNRLRTTCKECHGGAICAHQKRRFNCKECKREGTGGGGGICMHFKDKYSCKDCAAAGIGGPKRCSHGKIVGRCVECGGPNICEHKKVRQSCKFCLKVRACIHNKKRNICIDCKPIRDSSTFGFAEKAHELLVLFEGEKFYFHPRRDEVLAAIEELRKYALAWAPVPDPRQPRLVPALDAGGPGGAGEDAVPPPPSENGAAPGDVGMEGGGGPAGDDAAAAGAVPRTPGGVPVDPFMEELSSKSLSEIIEESKGGSKGAADMGDKQKKAKKPVFEPAPPPPPPRDHASTDLLRLDELVLSGENQNVPPQEYQKMMAAAHHLMAQHVMVMSGMKHSEHSAMDPDEAIMSCPHGKKSRQSCKTCREASVAARGAGHEQGVGGKVELGPDGGPADQGVKMDKQEGLVARKKKDSLHSLNEYKRMLNAADFLMREHIKVTKELNTNAQEKLREKQQREALQKQQEEYMLQQMEPPRMEAAELAKIHHQQILGLRVGPVPGSKKPPPIPQVQAQAAAPQAQIPRPLMAAGAGRPMVLQQQPPQPACTMLQPQPPPPLQQPPPPKVVVARPPDPNFVYIPKSAAAAAASPADPVAAAKAAADKAEAIEKVILKQREKAQKAAELRNLKKKKKGPEDEVVPHPEAAQVAEVPVRRAMKRPGILITKEQYPGIMRTGLLTRYQQEQYHEQGHLVNVELDQYEKLVAAGHIHILQQQAFQQETKTYVHTLQDAEVQAQMNLLLPSLSVSQECYEQMRSAGLLSPVQIRAYPIRNLLVKIDRVQFDKMVQAGVVSPYQHKVYEEAFGLHQQYKIDYHARLLALLQTPPHLQVDIPYLSISPYQFQYMAAAGFLSPHQQDQHEKQLHHSLQYMSILTQQYEALLSTGLLSPQQKMQYEAQLLHIKQHGRQPLPGEVPRHPNQKPPPPPLRKKKTDKELEKEGEAAQEAQAQMQKVGFEAAHEAQAQMQKFGIGFQRLQNVEALTPFAALAREGLVQMQRPQGTDPQRELLQERQQQMELQQRQRESAQAQAQAQAQARLLAAGQPPPMTEQQCKQMVYHHVLWLQQRDKATAPPSEEQAPGGAGGADTGAQAAAKAPAEGGQDAAAAVSAAQGDKTGESAKEGPPKDSAGEGKGEGSDALAAAPESEPAQLPASIQKALKEAQDLFKDGILSKEQYEAEQATILARNPQANQAGAPVKRRKTQKAERELIFDKYHQSLYNTVVHLLAPGQSAAAEQAAWAAWNLISEVIDPNHVIAQRWRMRAVTSMHSVKPRKKVCEHKRSKKEGCPDCDKMKLEMVSIIYSITTQYEARFADSERDTAAAYAAAVRAASASRPAGKKKGALRKRSKVDADADGKGDAEAAGDKSGAEGEGAKRRKTGEGNGGETGDESGAGGGADNGAASGGEGGDKDAAGATPKKKRERKDAPTEAAGWKQWVDDSGRKYYHHALRNITQWSRPAAMDRAPPEPQQPEKDGPTEANGWKQYTAPDGRKYYHHAAFHQTQWDRPPEIDMTPGQARASAIQRPQPHGFLPSAPVIPWQMQPGVVASEPRATYSLSGLLQTWRHTVPKPDPPPPPEPAAPKADKAKRNLCPHGRRRTRCKDCGDVAICVHGRAQSYCKECRAQRMCEHNKVKSRCEQCVCPHFRELGKTGQCADCKKVQRDKEVAAGHLTDNRTDDDGRNMETDDEGLVGGRAGGVAADVGGSEASATAKGMVAHLGQPPPPPSLPPASAPAGVSATAKETGDGDGSANAGSDSGASGLRAEGASVPGAASVSAFTAFKPAADGQGDDAKGKEPASADLKK